MFRDFRRAAQRILVDRYFLPYTLRDEVKKDGFINDI